MSGVSFLRFTHVSPSTIAAREESTLTTKAAEPLNVQKEEVYKKQHEQQTKGRINELRKVYPKIHKNTLEAYVKHERSVAHKKQGKVQSVLEFEPQEEKLEEEEEEEEKVEKFSIQIIECGLIPRDLPETVLETVNEERKSKGQKELVPELVEGETEHLSAYEDTAFVAKLFEELQQSHEEFKNDQWSGIASDGHNTQWLELAHNAENKNTIFILASTPDWLFQSVKLHGDFHLEHDVSTESRERLDHIIAPRHVVKSDEQGGFVNEYEFNDKAKDPTCKLEYAKKFQWMTLKGSHNLDITFARRCISRNFKNADAYGVSANNMLQNYVKSQRNLVGGIDTVAVTIVLTDMVKEDEKGVLKAYAGEEFDKVPEDVKAVFDEVKDRSEETEEGKHYKTKQYYILANESVVEVKSNSDDLYRFKLHAVNSLPINPDEDEGDEGDEGDEDSQTY